MTFISEHWDVFASLLIGLVGLISAITSLILSKVSSDKQKVLEDSLEKAKQRQTYTVCPHCHKILPLGDLPFFLPNGQNDNNLNGVPDDVE